MPNTSWSLQVHPLRTGSSTSFRLWGFLILSFLAPCGNSPTNIACSIRTNHNKINGYYNLQKLNKQLEAVLIRREKRKVIDQLPNLRQIDIPVELSPLQADYHASYAKGLAKIIRKKFLTPYDLQRMQLAPGQYAHGVRLYIPD